MTSEQKQAKLEVLKEAIFRICPVCKEEATSGKRTVEGTMERLHHRLADNEVANCPASPLHRMMVEINLQETD
jgi:urease gamma subunit